MSPHIVPVEQTGAEAAAGWTTRRATVEEYNACIDAFLGCPDPLAEEQRVQVKAEAARVTPIRTKATPPKEFTFEERVNGLLDEQLPELTDKQRERTESTYRCVVTITDYEEDVRIDEVRESESYRAVSRHSTFANATRRAVAAFKEQLSIMFGEAYDPEAYGEDGPEYLLGVKHHGVHLELSYNGEVAYNTGLTPSLSVVVEEEEPLED